MLIASFYVGIGDSRKRMNKRKIWMSFLIILPEQKVKKSENVIILIIEEIYLMVLGSFHSHLLSLHCEICEWIQPFLFFGLV